MQKIKTDTLTIYLNNELQTDPNNNRVFKYVGTKQVMTEPKKYIENKENPKLSSYKSIWLYAIRYIDTDETIGFQFGYDDSFMFKIGSEEMGRVWR